MFSYLGVDLGGASNTWGVVLRELPEKGLFLEKGLSLKEKGLVAVSLEEILAFVRGNRVLATSMDAPLHFSLKIAKGFRRSDLTLRELLPKEYRRWVLSYHALMGIPLRGYLLAQKLSPYCGAILETHPRASLYFMLPEEKKYLAHKYKREGLVQEEKRFLQTYFQKNFSLDLPLYVFENGDFLDALVCALVSYLYIKNPESLFFLPQEEDLTGFGPFVIYYSGFSPSA